MYEEQQLDNNYFLQKTQNITLKRFVYNVHNQILSKLLKFVTPVLLWKGQYADGSHEKSSISRKVLAIDWSLKVLNVCSISLK